jgi:hypothetical protein
MVKKKERDRQKTTAEGEAELKERSGEKRYRNILKINLNRKTETGGRERRCKCLNDYNASVFLKIFKEVRNHFFFNL